MYTFTRFLNICILIDFIDNRQQYIVPIQYVFRADNKYTVYIDRYEFFEEENVKGKLNCIFNRSPH